MVSDEELIKYGWEEDIWYGMRLFIYPHANY